MTHQLVLTQQAGKLLGLWLQKKPQRESGH